MGVCLLVEPEGIHDVAVVIFQGEEGEKEGKADTSLGNLPLQGVAS